MTDTDTRQLFFQAEVRAERILGWIRIAVALVLITLFAVTVIRNLPAGDPVLARQVLVAALTMAGYLALGLVSLALAHPDRLRWWHSWTLTTLDVGFVAVSLYIGLVNTEVPAKFMSGFPAMWLIPLVLAFGALRFNPLQQAYATLLFGAALLALALWAVPWSDPLVPGVPNSLDRLFEAPPNFMRLGMLMLAGAILVVAIARTRSLLTRAIDESRQRMQLTRYLPPELSDTLSRTGTDELRRGRRGQVAVLFVDIRGFTRRAESMGPAELSDFLTHFRRCITEAAARHGGVIDKFIGDGAMIVFGLTEIRDSAGSSGDRAKARNAIDGARRILDNLDDWNRELVGAGQEPVAVGIGGHWGEVFCGAVGDDLRLEFTVLGDTVNVAARIEELTKSAGQNLILSGDLLTAAGERRDGGGRTDGQPTHWSRLIHTELRGRDKPILLYAPVETS